MKGLVELQDKRNWTKTGWLKSLGQEEGAGEGSCTEVLKKKEAVLSKLRSSRSETYHEMEEVRGHNQKVS